MINFKTPLAYELADLLYKKIVDKGILDLRSEYEIFNLKPEYGLRRVSSGAILILREKDDLEELIDRQGNLGFIFKYKPAEKCIRCGKEFPENELHNGRCEWCDEWFQGRGN